MKALIICDQFEEAERLKNITQAKFKNIKLIISNSLEMTMDIAASEGPFGFIVLDVDMKNMDPNAVGLDLIDFIGDRPFLFYGTEQIYKDRVSDELLNSNEFNEFLSRPIDRKDFGENIIDLVDKVSSWAKEEDLSTKSVEINPEDYIPMKIKVFYLYEVFSYDLYMAITPTSYMRLVTADTPYTITMLANYAKKGVKQLYIKKDDQLKFLESEAQKCMKAMKVISPESPDLYLILLRAISVTHQYLNSIGVNPTVIDLADGIVDAITRQVKKVNDLKHILKNYPSFYKGVSSKSLLCAYLCLFLAKKMSWDSVTTIGKLVISSILQDFNLEEEHCTHILNKNSFQIDDMDEVEKEKFMQHPIDNSQVAKQFTNYPEVEFIIENHHELPNREGFPNQPSIANLTKITAVFNICQYIASALDTDKINQANINKVLKSMSHDFNFSSFKEPYSLVTKLLKFS